MIFILFDPTNVVLPKKLFIVYTKITSDLLFQFDFILFADTLKNSKFMKCYCLFTRS